MVLNEADVFLENFSTEEQDRIWKQFFNKLKKERRKDMSIDLSSWKYVFENQNIAQEQWNGRQIRNGMWS